MSTTHHVWLAIDSEGNWHVAGGGDGEALIQDDTAKTYCFDGIDGGVGAIRYHKVQLSTLPSPPNLEGDDLAGEVEPDGELEKALD